MNHTPNPRNYCFDVKKQDVQKRTVPVACVSCFSRDLRITPSQYHVYVHPKHPEQPDHPIVCFDLCEACVHVEIIKLSGLGFCAGAMEHIPDGG